MLRRPTSLSPLGCARCRRPVHTGQSTAAAWRRRGAPWACLSDGSPAQNSAVSQHRSAALTRYHPLAAARPHDLRLERVVADFGCREQPYSRPPCVCPYPPEPGLNGWISSPRRSLMCSEALARFSQNKLRASDAAPLALVAIAAAAAIFIQKVKRGRS